jgi:hypothetical protein
MKSFASAVIVIACWISQSGATRGHLSSCRPVPNAGRKGPRQREPRPFCPAHLLFLILF